MIIPEGVNQLEFYRKAKEKGIKIQSRYRGVSISFKHNGNIPFWFAKSYAGGKAKNLGLYSFTAEGEKEAYQAYLDWINTNGKNKQNLTKVRRKDLDGVKIRKNVKGQNKN